MTKLLKIAKNISKMAVSNIYTAKDMQIRAANEKTGISHFQRKNLLLRATPKGFNGYHQFPEDENSLPKVISKWTSFASDGEIMSCNHRFIVIKTEELIKIYGVLSDVFSQKLYFLGKPKKIDFFGSSDDYLIGSNGTSICKYIYLKSEWSECELKFKNQDEKSLWKETEAKVFKFSLEQNKVILLLKNGSVWMISEDNTLRLLFPHDLDKAIDISSGLEHSLILTESGCVLAFGNGSRGQLGHGDLNHIEQPVQIGALEGLKVIKIAAGGWHSCAIADSGDLYTWGWNNYGQLSAFEDEESVGLSALPICVQVGESIEMKVTDVACGRRHTVAVLENGNLFSCGWNAYSQLGIDTSCEKVSKFTRCQIQIDHSKKIMCGPWYTIVIEEPKK